MVINTVCLLICWSWSGCWNIVRKKGNNRIRGHWFQIGSWSNYCTLVPGVEKKNSRRACLLFLLFFWWPKRIGFKNSLDLRFHPLIFGFFDLLSYVSELRKRYTLRLLLIYHEVEEQGEVLVVVLPGGKWLTWGKGFPGKSGSMRKLYIDICLTTWYKIWLKQKKFCECSSLST